MQSALDMTKPIERVESELAGQGCLSDEMRGIEPYCCAAEILRLAYVQTARAVLNGRRLLSRSFTPCKVDQSLSISVESLSNYRTDRFSCESACQVSGDQAIHDPDLFHEFGSG